MHIVIVNDFGYVNGGAARVALSSALALAERGHHVIVVCAVGPAAEWLRHPNLSVICTGQHEIVRDPSRLRAATQGIWNRKAHRMMSALLSRLPVNETVVHLHGWTKALSSSVIASASQCRCKMVVTLHDYFSSCPNGGFFNYQSESICPLVPLSRKCITTHCDARSYPQKLWRVSRQAKQSYYDHFPACVDAFIGLSRMSVDRLLPYLPASARISWIRNPVSVPHGEPANVSRNHDFAFVGRLSREKGCSLLAEAASRIGADVVFIGDGTEGAQIRSIYPGAKITGWLPADAISAQLFRARALVLPSLWHEVQPLVIDEAAAIGIPALVPDTCAARENVVDGVTGLWFKGGDAEDLARKMEQLQKDGDLAARMGRAAYDRFWHDPPCMEHHVDALESMYRHVIPVPQDALGS